MDAAALEDLFGPLGPVTVKRMFGGYGVWADGLMFALQTGGEIFIKTDDETRPLFEAASLRPFIYTARGEQRATSYWLLPDAAMDDETELRRWCALAMEAARRTAARKPKRSAKAGGARTLKNAAAATSKKPAVPKRSR